MPITTPAILSIDKGQPLTPEEVAAGTKVTPREFLAYRYLPFEVFRLNM